MSELKLTRLFSGTGDKPMSVGDVEIDDEAIYIRWGGGVTYIDDCFNTHMQGLNDELRHRLRFNWPIDNIIVELEDHEDSLVRTIRGYRIEKTPEDIKEWRLRQINYKKIADFGTF